jgi:hypothetical protein
MEQTELLAKAAIAAALIASNAVEAAQIDVTEHWASQGRGRRLRELTDFVYAAITERPKSAESTAPPSSLHRA